MNMRGSLPALPIDPLLPEVVERLQESGRLVLRAEPGAGKTTRVPAAILDAGLAGDKEVVVLEPRRIAARSAAEFVARERGNTVGGEVGYRVRFEQRGSALTRLWFVTEGVLGRQLVRDPFLERVGVLVLDEFHERHLQSDLALAIARELQETVRPDLKVVVMSATLETAALFAYLGGCAVLISEGRTHPVEVEYRPIPEHRRLADHIATVVRDVFADTRDDGDVLIFLPGAAEIRRTAEAIEPLCRNHDTDVVLLHGDLPLDLQQRAIRAGSRRKVVLSTNVAETSLTVEGITTVIDSGLARIAVFDARHGINTVRVLPISQASAEQRAGRAGRLRPGRCIRLWSRDTHAHRRLRETPEIHRLDLSSMVLELRAWGLRDPSSLAWLDAPRPAALEQAERLLCRLGAIDSHGQLTSIGRTMLELPIQPRLARMLIEARKLGCTRHGALLAALACERDISVEHRAFGGSVGLEATAASDLAVRAEWFQEAEQAGFDAAECTRLGLDVRSVRSVKRVRRQLIQVLGDTGEERATEVAAALRCVLAGYPDRVVRRREPGSSRGVMVGGLGVVLSEHSVVRTAPWFVAIELEGSEAKERAEARVMLASAVETDWLREMFPAAVRNEIGLEFDAARERIVRRSRTLYEDLLLDERVDLKVDCDDAGERLAAIARENPERVFALEPPVANFLQRVRFLARWMPWAGFPDARWLFAETVASLCAGQVSFAEVRKADLLAAMSTRLSVAQRQALAREAPQRFTLPGGRQVEIRYEDLESPVVAARIQDVFGLNETPRIAGGKVPLVFHLLAPNHRSVQVTRDLQSFWRNTYPEVRRQLRGRYPKHAWPESPLGLGVGTVEGGRKGN